MTSSVRTVARGVCRSSSTATMVARLSTTLARLKPRSCSRSLWCRGTSRLPGGKLVAVVASALGFRTVGKGLHPVQRAEDVQEEGPEEGGEMVRRHRVVEPEEMQAKLFSSIYCEQEVAACKVRGGLLQAAVPASPPPPHPRRLCHPIAVCRPARHPIAVPPGPPPPFRRSSTRPLRGACKRRQQANACHQPLSFDTRPRCVTTTCRACSARAPRVPWLPQP